jgi:transcription antitermination factor NusG
MNCTLDLSITETHQGTVETTKSSQASEFLQLKNKHMSRLKIGDHVRILPNNPTPFANLEATVRAVREHERGVTVPDRYVVIFAWGEEQTFYDVQLEQMREMSSGQIAA